MSDLAPDTSKSLLRRAEALLRAGDLPRAVQAARDAVALDAGSARGHRILSGLLAAAGDSDAALAAAQEAVRIDPADADLRLHLGALLVSRRKWHDAATHLAQHVASMRVRPQGWRLLSVALNQTGHADRAVEAARNAVAADPQTAEYRLHLASLLGAQGQYDEALAELAQVLEGRPDHQVAWRLRSSVLAEAGRLSEALDAAERAVELAPEDEEGRLHLSHVAALCRVPAATDAALWQVERRVARVLTPRRRPSIRADIATRKRVIYAIMRRDIRTRFGHTRLGYVWAILEPIGHLLTLGTVFYLLNHSQPPLGDNMFLFYITGLVPFLMFSHVSHNAMGSADSGNAILQIPIIRRTDIIVAHSVLQLATELIVGGIIFGMAGLLGFQGIPANPARAAAGVLLLWLLGTGISAINVVVCELFPSYDTFYAALIRLLYFGSGIYYSPIIMPDVARDWLLWNPVLQGIDLFRSGFFNQYEPHWLDVNYLLAWIIGSLGLGFAMERALRPRMAMRT